MLKVFFGEFLLENLHLEDKTGHGSQYTRIHSAVTCDAATSGLRQWRPMGRLVAQCHLRWAALLPATRRRPMKGATRVCCIILSELLWYAYTLKLVPMSTQSSWVRQPTHTSGDDVDKTVQFLHATSQRGKQVKLYIPFRRSHPARHNVRSFHDHNHTYYSPVWGDTVQSGRWVRASRRNTLPFPTALKTANYLYVSPISRIYDVSHIYCHLSTLPVHKRCRADWQTVMKQTVRGRTTCGLILSHRLSDGPRKQPTSHDKWCSGLDSKHVPITHKSKR